MYIWHNLLLPADIQDEGVIFPHKPLAYEEDKDMRFLRQIPDSNKLYMLL